MTRIFSFLLCIGLLLTSCQPDATSTGATSNTTNAEAKQTNTAPRNSRLLNGRTDNPQLTQIANAIDGMMASNLVESIDFQNGVLTLKYYDGPDAYNNINGKTHQAMTAESFKSYWSSGSRSEKVICSVPAGLLNEFSFVQEVKTTLPTGEKVLHADITRDKLSELTGDSWADLSANWNGKYTNTIVRIPDGRAMFMKNLVH